jgi:hypothetical protein
MFKIQHNDSHCDHIEYRWVLTSMKDFQLNTRSTSDEFNQIIFQSVRGAVLDEHLRLWLQCIHETESFHKFLSYAFAACAWVRDLSFGKGERKLAYRMLWVIFKTIQEWYPVRARQMVSFMIQKWCYTILYDKPYGSWRDIKEFCHFVFEQTDNRRHPLIVSLLQWMIVMKNKPMVHKWFPREKTSSIYDTFVEEWCKHHGYSLIDGKGFQDLRTISNRKQAKCRRRVRKDLQLLKQTELLSAYAVQPKDIGIYKKTCNPGDLVRRVIMYYKYPMSPSKWNEWSQNKFTRVIRTLWREMNHVTNVREIVLQKMIPCVDVSEHMSDEQLEHAIGLALWIAQESRRLILVGDTSFVVEIDPEECICSQIMRVYNMCRPIRGTHFNIYEALHKHQFINVQIVLLGAFQCSLDDCVKSVNCLYENLIELTNPKQEFIFWNLKPTNGFPVMSTSAKCIMLSGYSPSELKIPTMVWSVHLEKIYTPYSHLLMKLNSYRYLPFINFIHSSFKD